MPDQTTTLRTEPDADWNNIWTMMQELGAAMADPQTTAPAFGEAGSGCRSCLFWKERQGNIGWCDFNYPTEKRGLTTPNHICSEWKYESNVR